jgi:hypothetical protein
LIGLILHGFFLCFMITLPRFYARVTDASFPLGSINAYSKFSTVRVSPTCSCAEVPTIKAASSDIRHLYVL